MSANALYYQAYGLSITSEIPLPELISLDDASQQTTILDSDIQISIGSIPEKIEQPLYTTKRMQLNLQEFILHVDTIAKYYVRDGRFIIIEPDNNTDIGDIRLYLLGTVFGILLHQRKDFPLHASAIVLPHQSSYAANQGHQAVAFCGASGAGKSTLLQSFSERGYKVLGDDIGVIRRQGNENWFYPGFPRIKLWQEALDHFNIDSQILLRDLVRLDKFHLKIEQQFHRKSVRLSAIIELKKADDYNFQQLETVEAIKVLMHNTYRNKMLWLMGGKTGHFKQSAAFLENTQVFQYQRPWSLQQLGLSTNYLVDTFQSITCDSFTL